MSGNPASRARAHPGSSADRYRHMNRSCQDLPKAVIPSGATRLKPDAQALSRAPGRARRPESDGYPVRHSDMLRPRRIGPAVRDERRQRSEGEACQAEGTVPESGQFGREIGRRCRHQAAAGAPGRFGREAGAGGRTPVFAARCVVRRHFLRGLVQAWGAAAPLQAPAPDRLISRVMGSGGSSALDLKLRDRTVDERRLGESPDR